MTFNATHTPSVNRTQNVISYSSHVARVYK